MSKNNSHPRSKRSQGAKPYDVSKAFVRRVAEHVTSIIPQSLRPSWLSSGNAPEVDSPEDAEPPVEQELRSSSQQEQSVPPPKRARTHFQQLQQFSEQNDFSLATNKNDLGPGGLYLSSRGVYSQLYARGLMGAPTASSTPMVRPLLGPPLTKIADVGARTIAESPSIIRHSPDVPRSAARLEPQPGPSGLQQEHFRPPSSPVVKEQHTDINGEELSDSSESTSGCSSLVPQGGRHEAEQNTDKVNSRSPAKLLEQPTSMIRRDRSQPQPPADNKRPTFDVSILGPQPNSIIGHEKSDVTTSPFYAGKTCYGGASAYKKINISPKISNISYESIFNLSASRSPRNRTFNSSMSDVPAARRIKVSPTKPISSPVAYSDPMAASSVARRILDTMESFSSPVSDCSRIPLDGKRKRPAADDLYDYRSPKVGVTSGPPITPLPVPRVPELLKMKLQESTVAVRRRMQEKKPAWQESRLAYSLRKDNEDAGHHNNKIGRKQKDVEDEMPAQVNLPKVALTLTTMPKIDLGPLPFSNSAASKSALKPALAPSARSSVSKPSSNLSAISKEEEELSLSFTFSDPIIVKQVATNNNVTPKINGPLSNIPSKISEFKDSKLAPSLAEKLKPAAPSLAAMFKPAEGTWVCEVCDVRNKPDVTKCVACCVEKPSSKTKPADIKPSVVTAPTVTQSFGSKFSNTGKWECSGCMCYNDNAVDKCPACTTLKPGATMAPKPAVFPIQTQGFGSKFSNSGKWECSVCMCLNSNDVDKCPSCTTPRHKPKAATAAAPIVKSGFGDQFKKPEGSWECSVCLVVNKDTVASKCVSCGSQKPGTVDKTDSSPKTNKLTFAFGASKSEDAPKFSFGCAPDNTKSEPIKLVKVASSNFSFGIPASKAGPVTSTTSAPSSSAATFTFGNAAPIKSPDTAIKSEEKKVVTFGAPTDAKPVTFGAFGASSSVSPKISSPLKRSADSELKSITFGAASEKPKEAVKISFPVSEADLKSDGFESKAEEPSTKRQSFGFNSPKTEVTANISAPLFSFGAPPSTSATGEAGGSNFVYTASATAPKPKAASPAPALFSFGGSSATTGSGFSNPTLGVAKPSETSFGVNIKPKESEAPKPVEAPKSFSFTATPSFGAAGASSNLGSPMAMTPTSTAPMFGTPKSAVPMFGASTTSSTPALPTFTPTTAASSTFPATTSAVTSFGSGNAAPMFGSTSSPMFGAPSSSNTSMFGSSATATPAFGSPIKSVTFGETAKPAAVTFGEPKLAAATNNTANTPFMFGAKPATNQAPPPAYPFGASSATPAVGGFSFGSNAGAPVNSQPSFAFGASNSQPAVENKPFAAFSANSTPSFPAVKPAEPSASVFGSSTPMFGAAQSSTPAFGATSQSFREQNNSTFPTPNFGFGAQPTAAPASFAFNSAQGVSNSVPPAVSFMFGQQQAQPSSQPPTFNPNIRPSFNFTAGAAPTTFQATPSAAGSASNPVAQRRIKKAMRRIQPTNR